MTDLDRRLASQGYNDETRQQSYATVLELQPLEEQSRRLSEAETGLPLEEESLAQSQEMLHRRRKELEELQQRFQADQEAAAALPQWQANLEQAKAEEDKLERQNQEPIGRRGYLQGQADRLQALRREIADNSSRLRSLQEDQGIYPGAGHCFWTPGNPGYDYRNCGPQLGGRSQQSARTHDG